LFSPSAETKNEFKRRRNYGMPMNTYDLTVKTKNFRRLTFTGTFTLTDTDTDTPTFQRFAYLKFELPLQNRDISATNRGILSSFFSPTQFSSLQKFKAIRALTFCESWHQFCIQKPAAKPSLIKLR
jgi:hypothetical protein